MSTGHFYLVMACDGCDENIYSALNYTTDTMNGHPVIPFDMASQTTFECDNCGTQHHLGDFDYMVGQA